MYVCMYVYVRSYDDEYGVSMSECKYVEYVHMCIPPTLFPLCIMYICTYILYKVTYICKDSIICAYMGYVCMWV